MYNLRELTPEEKKQYQDVAEELRCLVCQNQSIADSQAGLATDLKQIIVDQIKQGQSKAEIKQYMEARYGEFILYKPAFSAENAVLWLGPFILLFGAALLARKVVKSHKSKATSAKTQHSKWAETLYQKEQKSKNE